MEGNVTTAMVCLLFGINGLFFLLFQSVKWLSTRTSVSSADLLADGKVEKKEKELSKPLEFTVFSLTKLTNDLFKTGLIMLLTYICENNWIFAHSGKEYSRDLFMFVLIIFFLYAFYTIKPTNDLTLLSREQTEEWKG